MNELKMFVMDLGHFGVIMVVEKDEFAARKLMEQYYNYDPTEEVEMLGIAQGLVVSNYGDS
ncbi:hypothetical protein [Serratia sp. Se-RSBMAAmG]|uniref:hypothetical protein n=1 Tax=Serratia sp. Se-RSBMAAmG TaxID=3043305 RepID=UPI0024AED0AB|nr:hypothetical protein [Serratia sp. Se-RSBMAAmG]MDI6977123.1 hypothetical protein [Serratia sp. Se-RSBMAAmG]